MCIYLRVPEIVLVIYMASLNRSTPNPPRTHQNFNTGVIDDDGVEHSDRRVIARNYLTGWFWLDTSSGVPFDLIDLLMQDDSGMSDARTLKVLKTGASH